MVLGGLIVSTLFTLVLVPTLFSLTMDAKQWGLNLLRPGLVEQVKASVAPPEETKNKTQENVTV